MAGLIDPIYKIMCDYGHTFLGIAIALILSNIFSRIRIPTFVLKPIFFLDSISYEGYLVHQFFILGVFSFLHFFDSSVIAIIAIFLVTFILGSVIKLTSEKIKQMLLYKNIRYY